MFYNICHHASEVYRIFCFTSAGPKVPAINTYQTSCPHGIDRNDVVALNMMHEYLYTCELIWHALSPETLNHNATPVSDGEDNMEMCSLP